MRTSIQRVMVFDVETSGLIPKDRSNILITALPYILQLSFVIFETNGWNIVKTMNTYVNISHDVPIAQNIYELTGITREMCNNGYPMHTVLREFINEYQKCDFIVAHNIQFDREMIKIELERNRAYFQGPDLLTFDREYEKEQVKTNYCTMYGGRNLCKIERKNAKGETYYKSPKLVELHEHLFSKTPKNLHNSLIDTFICLRCFIKMRFKFELSLKHFPHIEFE